MFRFNFSCSYYWHLIATICPENPFIDRSMSDSAIMYRFIKLLLDLYLVVPLHHIQNKVRRSLLFSQMAVASKSVASPHVRLGFWADMLTLFTDPPAWLHLPCSFMPCKKSTMSQRQSPLQLASFLHCWCYLPRTVVFPCLRPAFKRNYWAQLSSHCSC